MRRQADGFTIVFDRMLIFTEFIISNPTFVVGKRKLRIELYDVAIILNRLPLIAEAAIGITSVIISLRITWFDFYRPV